MKSNQTANSVELTSLEELLDQELSDEQLSQISGGIGLAPSKTTGSVIGEADKQSREGYYYAVDETQAIVNQPFILLR